MSLVKNLYLFFYNIFQALGWALALFRIFSNFFSTKSLNGTNYDCAAELIRLLQALAFLEVIHGAVGIVPSGVLLPLMQWGGRTYILHGIICGISQVQELPSVFVTFVAWSLSEVIRYSHYALNCIGNPPNWITHVRYSAFIALYPIGVFPGEMWLMYKALPYIKKENLYADKLPFSYYNFVRVFLFVYPLLWLKLYLHLFKQRRSKLGKNQKKKRN